MKLNNNIRKLIVSILMIVVLGTCLCILTFALEEEKVSVDKSFFRTGIVEVNLNDGKAIVEEDEFLFSPGMTVRKDFFIENKSTEDVYYRLYFDSIEGELVDVLEITVKDGSKTLYHGLATEMTRENVGVAKDMLRLNEQRELSIYFHILEEADNSTQSSYLTFSIKADAVQAINNPNKLFD